MNINLKLLFIFKQILLTLQLEDPWWGKKSTDEQ